MGSRVPELPKRKGPRPESTQPTFEDPVPHRQTSQNAPVHLQKELLKRIRLLPGVLEGKSEAADNGGVYAFELEEECAQGPAEAFQKGREFAHMHFEDGGGLHLTLPLQIKAEVLNKGWGEHSPTSGSMLVWGPRDDEELEVLWKLARASYEYARGSWG